MRAAIHFNFINENDENGVPTVAFEGENEQERFAVAAKDIIDKQAALIIELQSKSSDSDSENTNLAIYVDELKEKNEKWEKSFYENQQAFDELKAENETLTRTKGRLESVNEKLVGENKSLMDAVSTLQKSLSANLTLAETRRLEVQMLQRHVEILQKEKEEKAFSTEIVQPAKSFVFENITMK